MHGALLAALLTPALSMALVAAHPPAPGSPLPLRWVRTATRHPLRTGLAGALLALALGPAGRPRTGSRLAGSSPVREDGSGWDREESDL